MKDFGKWLSAAKVRAFLFTLFASVLCATLPISIHAQTRTSNRQADPQSTAGKTRYFDLTQSATDHNGRIVTPQGGGPAVKGSGTAGMIPKWLDTDTLGDSIITESSGKIGLGTTSPTSTLTVSGSTNTLIGVIDVSDGGTGFALHASTTGGFAAMRAFHHGTAGIGVEAIGPIGLVAHGTGGFGLVAFNQSATDAAVYAFSLATGGMAVEAEAEIGIKGRSSRAGGVGVLGDAGLGALAGKFMGDVQVTGNLTKGGGSFKIDHPLDPENKYLYHSFVESSDMMNIYNGNVKLDANGEAVVELPEWFGTLNKDFRYSLTALGAPGPNLHIAAEVADNHFKVAGGAPGMKISWQVTGIRQDAWATKHRIPVVEQKSDAERGFYLHPDLYNQPEEKSVEWARNPQTMQRMKQERELIKQRMQQENR